VCYFPWRRKNSFSRYKQKTFRLSPIYLSRFILGFSIMMSSYEQVEFAVLPQRKPAAGQMGHLLVDITDWFLEYWRPSFRQRISH
jgi:hypothetical protein